MWHKTLEEDYVAQVRQKSLPDLLIKNGDGEIRKYINFFRFGDQELKDLVKPIQHFIHHNKNAMLDEMLDRFNRTQKQQKKKKSSSMKKNRVE